VRLSFLFSLLIFSFSAAAADIPYDPFIWLEEVQGEAPVAWADQRTNETIKKLEQDPSFEKTKAEALKILAADDKVTFASYRNGFMWEFRQDKSNPRGVIRKTTLEEYKKNQPQWETIFDLDALENKENQNWVYHGATAFNEKSNRRLIQLSRGGKDAVEIREFDYGTKQFVKDGFFVPEAKTHFAAIDENTLLISTDFGPDSLTDSGYPRTVKIWKRGEPLENAKTVYECDKKDVLAYAATFGEAPDQYIVVGRSIAETGSEDDYILKKDGTKSQLIIPERASLQEIYQDYVYLSLSKDLPLSNRTIKANTIIRYHINDKDLEKAEVVFSASATQSISGGIAVRDGHAYIEIMDNIKSRALRLDRQDNGEWKQTVLPFPETGIFSLSLPRRGDPNGLATLVYEDFLTPDTQYQVHMDDNFRLESIKSAPARFDSSQMVVHQYFAISKDGTKVPYFVVHKKDLVYDGNNPTLQYGYGGFEVSQFPGYSPVLGKVWLEPGGVYVLTNIRGGGEFGPNWHLQAIKENRQKVYDDFIAISEDLIGRKITNPEHLGIQGGSNGGLMVAAVMVQRPDLYNAVVSQVPLIDMIRYSKLPPGASWMSEYGNPDIPEECEYLLALSPYQNVRPGVRFPEPLFETSRADDRVHPGHARKIVMRMTEQGHKVNFIEKADGGHGGGITPEKRATEISHTYSYLWSRLR